MANSDTIASRKSIPLNESSDGTAPLAGCIICCTSVPDEKRTQLAEYAQQMGAIHRYDLTLDVTHLVVGDYNTPKYRYVAKERPDVKPMTTDWVEAARELWINDKAIDLEALEKEHTLPVLRGLKFSMTGCDNTDERMEIAREVQANGATYEGDLTKHITHLISFRTEGAKYKAAKSWGLRIVSIEWLRDSLERGMILDEKLYDPILPVEKRGENSWDRTKPRTSLGKRQREESGAGEASRRKLRRTASAKLNSQSEKIWGDIVGGGNVTEVTRSGVWDSHEEPTQPNTMSDPKKPRQESRVNIRKPLEEIRARPQGIFSGCRFHFYGFPPKKSKVMCDHLLPHGAEISETLEKLSIISEIGTPDHLLMIVPHNLPVSQLPEVPKSGPVIEVVTEWWVERCLHHKKFMHPTEHVVGRPFPMFPIEGFKTMVISTSAFTGIDLLHVKKVVELLGATYSEDMTRQTSILITASIKGLRKDKLDHAQDWNIPIAQADWLWDCIEAGTRLATQKYRCRSQKRSDSLPNTARATHEGSKDPHQNSRPNSATEKPLERSKSMPSKRVAQPAASSGIDKWAFDAEPTSVTVKEEQYPHMPLLVDEVPDAIDTPKSEDASCESEPRSERDMEMSSSSKTVSTAPAPSCHPLPRPTPVPEELGNCLSDLLAKSKKSAQPSNAEQVEGGRRRGANRILGRVTSNISTTSSHSRATSVDSTATHGHPVEYPPSHPKAAKNEQMDFLLNGDKNAHNVDSQPPATQLQYDDPDSNDVAERIRARLEGEKLPSRKSIKEKALTISDFDPTARARDTRRSRALR
ncbi:BRCT domain-containing protein [Tricladium varicosporioides]|nr:BRCT domain-containing protein [Hymenoscyphus varicosporioides]